MSFTPLHPSKPRILIAAAAGLFFLGAAQATDLYDSLKIWQKQSDEAQKIRDQREAPPPPALEQTEPSLTNPSGPQGPIRTDMSDEQPATQQPAPQSDEANREQMPNDPHKPSP